MCGSTACIAIEGAFDVEVEGFVEQIVVDFEKFCAPDCSACRVEKKLHAAETVNGKLDHVFDGCALGDVDGQCQRLTADVVDLLGRLFDTGLVDVGADDIGLLTCENQCGGAADAAGRAGDDDGFAREIIR